MTRVTNICVFLTVHKILNKSQSVGSSLRMLNMCPNLKLVPEW